MNLTIPNTAADSSSSSVRQMIPFTDSDSMARPDDVKELMHLRDTVRKPVSCVPQSSSTCVASRVLLESAQ
jgi:hypothetical protein